MDERWDFQRLLASAVKAARIAAPSEKSQAEMAEFLAGRGLESWSRPVLAAVETGGRKVSPEEVLALGVALRLPLRDLLGLAWERGDENPPEWVFLTESLVIDREGLLRLLEGDEPETLRGEGHIREQQPEELNQAIEEARRELERSAEPTAAWTSMLARLMPGEWEPPPASIARSWWQKRVSERAETAKGIRSRQDSSEKWKHISQLLDDRAGEFDKYVARRLGVPVPWVTLVSLLLWRRTASRERSQRTRGNVSKHLVSREITDAIVNALVVHPAEADLSSPRQRVVEAQDDTPAPGWHRPPTGKYKGMYEHLRQQVGEEYHMSFAEIEALLPHNLPSSARAYRAWWANDSTHSHARAWLAARWEVESVDFSNERVSFRRTPQRTSATR